MPEIHDYDAGHYFGQLERFLATRGIEDQLARIDNELRTETGVYLERWVRPLRAWWLEFGEARDTIRRGGSFRGRSLLRMNRPFQTAIKLSVLYRSMPPWKRLEFRSRILKADLLQPILFEIDCAAHFWQLGYDIEWVQSPGRSGARSPEFIGRCGGQEVEVECKAKKLDAGRRVERRSFFKAIDRVISIVRKKALCGTMYLTLPSRSPKDIDWLRHSARSLDDGLGAGSGTVALTGGGQLDFLLHPLDGAERPIRDAAVESGALDKPYAHFAIFGTRRGEAIADAVVFRMESARPDAFLEDVLESLRDAEHQFSGSRAAIVCCLLPDIDSFEGLQADSAIQLMTHHFFEKHARDCINAISYVSEMKQEIDGSVVVSDCPSLTFRNARYNEKYGTDIPVYASGNREGRDSPRVR